MKFRISNNINYALEFEALSEYDFKKNLLKSYSEYCKHEKSGYGTLHLRDNNHKSDIWLAIGYSPRYGFCNAIIDYKLIREHNYWEDIIRTQNWSNQICGITNWITEKISNKNQLKRIK
ncbi:MAG: hypothetical protein ACFFDN_04910 [Candidatus Hodarchaeota archaeon]